MSDVRDRPIGADPQMPKGSGREAWGRRHQQTNQTWRPRVRDDARDTAREESRNEEEVIPPWRLNQQRHAQRVARSRNRWVPTGIYGNREPQWEELCVCILGLKTKMIFGMSRHLVNGSSRSTSDLYHREEHMRGGCAI